MRPRTVTQTHRRGWPLYISHRLRLTRDVIKYYPPSRFFSITWKSRSSAIQKNRWNLQGCPKLPDRSQPLVGRSSPYCGSLLWRRYCCLTSFFPIVDTCLICEDISRQSCAMVPRSRFFDDFLRPVFAASPVQHVSDLHLKFALRPHHVCKYGRHRICDGWD